MLVSSIVLLKCMVHIKEEYLKSCSKRDLALIDENIYVKVFSLVLLATRCSSSFAKGMLPKL